MKKESIKIGIVGLGYWGKIILRNLIELGYEDIVVCEKSKIDWNIIGKKFEHVTNYEEMECDYVFVIVPVDNHYEVCKHFLKKGCKVFCEKPLDTKSKKCEELYNIADLNGGVLFVDWLFTFNPAVNKIKNIISRWGNPKNIIMNRLNFGPIREDVNARWDLASHDVSICCHILEQQPSDIKWIDFKRNKLSKQEDSCVGIIKFPETTVQINASWEYGTKNRMCIFEFKNKFLYWDDTINSLMSGSDMLEVCNSSPLHLCIQDFVKDFDKTAQRKQRKLTNQITEILNK